MQPATESPIDTERPWERWSTALAAVVLGLVCVFVVLTVAARWLGQVLVPDDVQIVRQLLIAVILLPLASVSALRMHIEVTLVADRLPATWGRALIRFGQVVGLVVVGLLLWGGWSLLQDSWTSGEYHEGELRIPHWLGHAVYVAALASGALRLLRDVLRRDRPRSTAAPAN